MRDGLIEDHGYQWTQGAFTLIIAGDLIGSAISLTSGRSLSDWASFTCTVRQDPGWPRYGAALAKSITDNLNPVADGWAVTATLTNGTVSAGTIRFTVSAGTFAAGLYRYSFDVEGVGGAAGNSPIVVATWVTRVFAADYAG